MKSRTRPRNSRLVSQLSAQRGRLSLYYLDPLGFRGGRYDLTLSEDPGHLDLTIGLSLRDLISLHNDLRGELERAAKLGH